MKLRLLNASHQALCYPAYLAGYRLVDEVLADPVFEKFISGYMAEEGGPTVPRIPGVDLVAYQQTLMERFGNREVRDTVARLCAESSDRIPKWLLPVVRQNLRTGGEIRRSAAVVASWARYAEGVDENGEPINVVDRLSSELTAIARQQRDNPTTFIENRNVFGDLVDDTRFVGAYLDSLESFHAIGARRTIAALNDSLRGS
jgi:mannitol 2-dehydrogenase